MLAIRDLPSSELEAGFQPMLTNALSVRTTSAEGSSGEGLR